MKNGISIGKGILWVIIWFGFMLIYTSLDIVLWRNIFVFYGKYLNIFTIILCMIMFIILLTRQNDFKIYLFKNISFQGVILSIGCAILFYFVLDKGLDPVFENMFPISEKNYQQSLESLSRTPVIALIKVCIFAPIIEEILMRGFLLDGLSIRYKKAIALIVSSLLFALLHFNMVQTLSAFVCGIVLGLLYFRTDSILCCMLTHILYNLISYITVVMPLYSK